MLILVYGRGILAGFLPINNFQIALLAITFTIQINDGILFATVCTATSNGHSFL